MSVYTYPELPPEGTSTRMIRLLPQKEKKTPIDCELFNYQLSDTAGHKHRYEALSYVWGSGVRSHSIRLNGCEFPVTENLHAALSHLRDTNFERILWVDAICINQEDDEEKGQQIQIMRTIYGQARCVVVWLGEAVDDGDTALESIRQVTERDELKERPGGAQILRTNDSCLPLLQRDWFRRIWVLQEVGLARSVSIVCGPTEVNGYAFCEGLSRLTLPASAQERIRPVIHLIRGAIFRPQYQLDSRGDYSIGQLMDMYRFHDATVPHDKVYALLGLCSDDPNAPGLKPNYRLPWHEVFAQVITYILSRDCSVETWPERNTAVIKGQGCILGQVEGVQDGRSENGQQRIDVVFTKAGQQVGYESRWGARWVVQASPVSIQKGDIVVLLQGAAMPSIVRVSRDHFTIIVIAAKPHQGMDGEILEPEDAPGACVLEHPLHHLLLTWELSPANPGKDSGRDATTDLSEKVPEYRDEQLSEANRIYDMSPVIEEIALEVLKVKDSPSSAMERLLLQIASHIPITENVVKAVAGSTAEYAPDIMDSFFKYRGEGLSISEGVVKEAAGNTGLFALAIFKLLLQHRGERLPFSETVAKAAVGNTGPGAPRIVELLQDQQGWFISEEVVRAAAENAGKYGPEILEILFQRRGDDLPMSEDVVKAAVSGNKGEYGPKLLEVLFQHLGDRLPISESVVMAAAGSTDHYVQDIFELLLQHRGDGLPISDDTVKAILGGSNFPGPNIMRVILQHRQDRLNISEDMVQVVAGNIKGRGDEFMNVLFQARGDSLPVSEAIVRAAAENTGYQAHKMMDVLLRSRGNRLPIPEDAVQSLLQSREHNAATILDVILRHRGQSLPVSEELVKTAVGNTGLYGGQIVNALLRHCAKDLPITEAVVQAAAGNTGRDGPVIMELLFQHRGESLPITEAVVKAAAENTGFHEGKIMDALLRHGRERVPITEAVVMATVVNPSMNSFGNMNVLLQHRGPSLPISEEIIKTAIGREQDWGIGLLHIMFQHRGGNMPISEEVVKLAAGSDSLYARQMIELFLTHLGDRLPVTEEVIRAADSNRDCLEIINLFLRYRGESIHPLVKSVVTSPLILSRMGLGGDIEG